MIEVVFVELLSLMAPAISPEPTPLGELRSFKVFEPAPETMKALVNFKRPEPDWSMVAPPVVPERSIKRFVVSPVPEYTRTPAMVRLPILSVEFATSTGAPKELDAKELTNP
jgi:hypothetical protein